MVEYFKGDADTHLATFRMYNLQFYVEKKTIRASNMPLSDLKHGLYRIMPPELLHMSGSGLIMYIF